MKLTLLILITTPALVYGYTIHPSKRANWPDYKVKFNKAVEQPKEKFDGKNIDGSYLEYLRSIPHDEHPYPEHHDPAKNTWDAYKEFLKEQMKEESMAYTLPKHLKDHVHFEEPAPKSSQHHAAMFDFASWAEYKKHLDTVGTKKHGPIDLPKATGTPPKKKYYPVEAKHNTWNDYKEILQSHFHPRKNSNWDSYKETIGEVAKEQQQKHSYYPSSLDAYLREEPASTMHHEPAKVEKTNWDTYSHKYHLGDLTISTTTKRMEGEDELREIVQTTISQERKPGDRENEESPTEHLQRVAEALLDEIHHSKKKEGDHFSGASGFNH